MHLGIRVLFGFFLITGLAAFFILRVFVTEVRPSVREVMEDMMVDTANILAELASDDLRDGHMNDGRFAIHVAHYAQRPVEANIWGLDKRTLDYRVYVTDGNGTVKFDSLNLAVGQDYSQWRDVARTLRGDYGARATREIRGDDKTSVMYIAAPVLAEGKVIGVLTVSKPVATIQRFVDRAERKILLNGLWLLLLSAAIGVAVTLWVVWNIRKLKGYANAIDAGTRLAPPRLAGELGELAGAMEAMRVRLEGRAYVESYVRAVTHELKSPLSAIRGAGELLLEPLPEADRRAFGTEVLQQTQRMQSLVDRLLDLTKLEQRQALTAPQRIRTREFLQAFADEARQRRPAHAAPLHVKADDSTIEAEPELLRLALANLVDNATAFTPAAGTIELGSRDGVISVQDTGPGIPDFALGRLGEKFFSTVRPDGVTKGSGLGLAIVQQIMALHHGRMDIRNTTPGVRVELHFTPASQTSH